MPPENRKKKYTYIYIYIYIYIYASSEHFNQTLNNYVLGGGGVGGVGGYFTKMLHFSSAFPKSGLCG